MDSLKMIDGKRWSGCTSFFNFDFLRNFQMWICESFYAMRMMIKIYIFTKTKYYLNDWISSPNICLRCAQVSTPEEQLGFDKTRDTT